MRWLTSSPLIEFAVTADNIDNGFGFYSLSFSMKLNIHKLECSFTLLTTMCIVGGVTSRFLSHSIFEYLTKRG